jgi:hypothetical protein
MEQSDLFQHGVNRNMKRIKQWLFSHSVDIIGFVDLDKADEDHRLEEPQVT